MATYAKVRNVGDTIWDDGQPGNPYTIRPGEELIVPWGMMCVWLGDPEARDSQKVPARQEEYTRLATRYGVGSGLQGDKRGTFDECRPKLVASTIDGEPLATVCDDKDGLDMVMAAPLLSPGDTAAKIAALEQALAALTATLPTAEQMAQSSPAFIPSAPGPSTDALIPEPDTSGLPPADAPSNAPAKGTAATPVPSTPAKTPANNSQRRR